MKIAKILGLCLLSCIFSACPEQSEKYITLVNKSERDIVYQEYRDRNLTIADTLFLCSVGAVGVFKGSSSLIESVDDTGWKADFNVVPCMQFLIMDREIYRKYMFEPCRYNSQICSYSSSLSGFIRRYGTSKLDNSLSP